MSNKQTKLEPWQIYHIALQHLTPGRVAGIYGKINIRSAYDWAQSPYTTAKRCRSPLERTHELFRILDQIGFGYAARAGIAYLQTALTPEVLPELDDLKPTMIEEELADYQLLSEFQAAINHGASVGIVKDLKQKAVDEIERTLAKYIQEKQEEKENG